MKKTICIIACISLILWAGARIYNGITFDQNCEGHLKLAADANTVELAQQQLSIAVKYCEDNGLTKGYTSIFYRTPDEDIEFWYNNLKSSLNELNAVSADATQLEKSNILMKLRETLLDDNGETSVTFPVTATFAILSSFFNFLVNCAAVIAFFSAPAFTVWP